MTERDQTTDRAGGVVDDVGGQRFVLVEDGVEAELTYRERDGRLVLVHTGVPDEIGGRGIAGRLVQAAVDRAARTGEVLVPRCPYARSWLARHPDEASAVTVEGAGDDGTAR